MIATAGRKRMQHHSRSLKHPGRLRERHSYRPQLWGWPSSARDSWLWVKAPLLADAALVSHGFDEPRRSCLPAYRHALHARRYTSILAADDTQRTLSERNAAGTGATPSLSVSKKSAVRCLPLRVKRQLRPDGVKLIIFILTATLHDHLDRKLHNVGTWQWNMPSRTLLDSYNCIVGQ
jgi:hypothetical protein